MTPNPISVSQHHSGSNQLLYRYYCSSCGSVLKDSPLDISAPVNEPCPYCDAPLSHALTRTRTSAKEVDPISNRQRLPKRGRSLEMPLAKPVLDLLAPNFGIASLDRLLPQFGTSLCITGPKAEYLFWRAIVRALLPKRANGKGFSKVLLIDAGNCSDIYLCVDYARQQGLSLTNLLDNIIVSRAFTVYQLAALVRDVRDTALRIGADMIAVADMAKMFVADPQIQREEENTLASKIASDLACSANQVPVIAFASSFYSPHWIAQFETKVETKDNEHSIDLTISRSDKGANINTTIAKKELLVAVPFSEAK